MERKTIKMSKCLIYLTFIPWLIIFIISIINNLNNESYHHFSFKYLFSNFFKIFRIDLLFLIIMYYYFTSFKLDFVSMYLFAVMNIYLIVNSFYEHKNKFQTNFFKNNILNFLILLIVTLIPFLIFIVQKDLVLTYRIMLIYLFIEYPILIITTFITKIISKLFLKLKK